MTSVGKGLTITYQAQRIMTGPNGHQLCSIRQEVLMKTIYIHMYIFHVYYIKVGKKIVWFLPHSCV
jgi:hypothetical protein